MRRVARIVRAGRRIVFVLVALWVAELVLDASWTCPDIAPRPAEASRLFLARDGALLRVTPNVRGERCLPVRLAAVSPHVVTALVCAEDRRFRSHGGVDPLAVVRAAGGNLAAGRVVSGASTLTMQLARLVEPRPRTFAGKALEALRARQIERRHTKDEILEAYLNQVPFGGTTRGIEAAAWRWFGKSAKDLGLAEAATLVAMLPAPTSRAPDLGGAGRLRAARRAVLARMVAAGAVDAETAERAARADLPDARRRWTFRAPHACDLLGGTSDDAVVRTTIDLGLQTRVEDVVRGEPSPGVDGVAVVVLDRDDGSLRALLGSRDYRTHPLNAAACRRSAGSTLKPFLYALALDDGLCGPDGLLQDTPLAFGDYAPRNFEGAYRGAVTTRDALAASRNLPAIRLLRDVGPGRFADVLRSAGIRVPGHALHVDAALGTLSVSPLALADAYRRLAGPDDLPGLSERARRQVVDALSASGPGGLTDAAEPVAWKTGTSSGRRDAWCAGVTSEHVIVVWYGRLDGAPAPELVGGRAAADLLAALVAAL